VPVLVTPAVAIGASSIAAATVIETLTPHNFVSGDTVLIAGHVGSTPALDGSRIAIVIDPTHLSVPVAVTIAGAGGSVTREIAAEPLTLTEGKLRAGLDWAEGDPRDALMRSFIAAARSKVQQDTGVVPVLETYDVRFDALPRHRTPIALPWRPVASVTSFASIDSAGVTQTLDPSQYVLDPGSDAPRAARLALSDAGAWPTDLRSFQPYVLRIVVGYASIARIPPWFVHAVGRLTAHYATLGRDLASLDPAVEVPFGYEDDIAPYRLVTVA
jgi:uncharacterized phiE125 gp8 family phage protein